MFHLLQRRTGHHLLLILVAAVLFLPNLGKPGLWDIDEGNNAEASREMLAGGNAVVPTFNYQLRPDKPALLYWLQMAGYRLLGVGELAARLPSALAGLAAVLVTYELGCSLFGPATGLLSGLVLATSILFCAAARFANPDALLVCFTTLTLLLFWQSLSRRSPMWVIAAGASAGVAMLAKGPVGLFLPGTVALGFLAWSGRFRWLLAQRVVWGLVVSALVALPWYAWVGAETHGDFLRGFLLSHNAGRYLHPMEGHHGGPSYYLLVLVAGLAPWSPFLGLAAWYAARREPEDADCAVPIRDRYRFLACWIAVYLVFFSLGATKLPNYVLPLYPAAAVFLARFLDRWRQGTIAPAPWAAGAALVGLVLVGVGSSVVLLMISGRIDHPALHGRRFPELEAGAAAGLVPIVAAAVAAWLIGRRRLAALPLSLGLAALFFVGPLAAWAGQALNAYKAPEPLARLFRADRREQEIRLGSFDYDQPSLVFYCRREVRRLASPTEALEFLDYPVPVYLFTPEPTWDMLRPLASHGWRILGQHYDLYRNCQILLVTNR